MRPQASIVIFDSHTPINAGRAVYMSAVVDVPSGDDLDRGIGLFSRRSVAHGAGEWARANVLPPARLRLCRATASEHFVLGPDDRRISVSVG